MNKASNLISLLLSISLIFSISAFSQDRTVKDISYHWKFIKKDLSDAPNPAIDDSKWDDINLPHTWNNLDGQDGGGNFYRGIGWYRYKLNIDEKNKNKKIFLKFNSANMRTEVFINGISIGTHTGGFAAFDFDITDKVTLNKENTIAVKVDNSESIKACPLTADFTFFGGITRTVELIFTNKTYITPMDFASCGVYITQKNVSEKSADISVKTKIKNDNASENNITIKTIIKDLSGKTVQQGSIDKTIPSGTLIESTNLFSIANPHLWNAMKDPYTYSVTVQLYNKDLLLDEVTQPLGIRYYRIDANQGFFLNGMNYKLHGVAFHEDRKNKGRAISDQDRKNDIKVLKEMGCTYFRLTHYQHGDYTYRYCDTAGIVLWTEIPLVNKVDNSKEFADNAKQQLIELIRQNYNHPSILFWGLCNEIDYHSGPKPDSLVNELNILAHHEDSTRLTTLAAMYDKNGTNAIPDLYAGNKYHGWYYETINDFATWASKQHTTFPNLKLGVSEYGAGGNITHHEDKGEKPAQGGPFHPEEYQNVFHETFWKTIQSCPYLWSSAVWVGFDFSCDGRNEGGVPGINDKGLLTHDHLTKKDAYYFYQANWSDKPVIYITGRHYEERTGNEAIIKVYSNCETVKLTINGREQKSTPGFNHIFNFKYSQFMHGKNMILATGILNGKEYTDLIYLNFK